MANTIIFERLFPIIVKRKLKNLQIENESISYITTPATAKYIEDIIFEYSLVYNCHIFFLIIKKNIK